MPAIRELEQERILLPATLAGSSCRLRPWTLADKPALVRHANNRAIARNMTDGFPHPYTDDAADQWLSVVAADPHADGIYAIDVGGEAIGTLALERQSDIMRLSAEIGYWLAEPFWGRGIATEAVRLVMATAFESGDLVRVFAPVFAWNTASMRVLEKNGFTREAVLRRAGFKDGIVFDRVFYARTRESDHPYVPADS